MSAELWLAVAVDGYGDLYQVSTQGRVRSVVSDLILSPGPQSKEYLTVSLCRNNKPRSFLVHRLVALTWVPNLDPARTQVNHKDGNKQNNRVSNLEWMTASENMRHAFRLKKQAAL